MSYVTERKQETKSERVQQALLRSWRTSSDREIAKRLGVSNRTVTQHRRRLETAGLILLRPKSTQAGAACQYEVCTSAIEPAALND